MMLNSQRMFDHIISLGTGCVGFAIGHNLMFFRDASYDHLILLAGLASWGAGVVGVKLTERAGVVEIEQPAAPLEHRMIPNLNNEPNGFSPIGEMVMNEQRVSVAKVRDPRLKQWAYAVAYNGAKMTQSKWAGGKRLFSRPEYERWIACLLEKEIVAPANPRNPAGGYKPNGAQGWQTIKKIADGTTYIPLPAAVMSEAGVRFVSARMRERYAEGEGSLD